ncbi:MAG: hypothetical protein ABEH77_07850 [Halobacteriaceae archaeon]
MKLSFAFILFWFGAQKSPLLVQGASPVRADVVAFVKAVGFGSWIPLPVAAGLLFVGMYEVTLGGLFVLNWIEELSFDTSYLMYVITPMLIAHQFGTFMPLVLIPEVVFRQTSTLFGLPLPFALDWMSAFIFKNLLFIGAFAYYYVEWADRYGFETPAGQ